MRQFKYIGNIDKNELNDKVVHACINENGYRCILIKNKENKTVVSNYNTDNLEIKFNAELFHECNNYYFHILTSKKNDIDSNYGFEQIYDYIFKKIVHPISDSDLSNLVVSLEEYFKITPDNDLKQFQIGVWGELFSVKNLHFLGYTEIVDKYHVNFYSKHDIEINDRVRVEIKTSTNQKRVHHVSHDQICRKDIDVYLISQILEETQEGTSLWQLFQYVIGLQNNPDRIFALQKLIKKCGVSQSKEGFTSSEEKARQDVRYFNAKQLPMIQDTIPQGVSNVEYDVDCALSEPLSEQDFLSTLK